MRKILVALALGAALLEAPLATAATYTVCASGCDYASVQAAITAATAGDALTLSAETFTEAEIVVNKDLVIQGAGMTDTIVQASTSFNANQGRVFQIDPDVAVTIRDMTLRNGDPLYDSTSLYSRCGGAVHNQGTILLERVRLADGQADYGGSAVYTTGDATLVDCWVNNNYYDSVLSVDASGSLTLLRTRVSGNMSTPISASGALALIDSSITGNRGTYAVYVASELHATNTTISDNWLDVAGVYASSGRVYLDQSTVAGNILEEDGAGIYEYNSGMAYIRNTIVADNLALGVPADCRGVLESFGYSIVESSNRCAVAINATGDLLGVDPRLQPLDFAGGPTPVRPLAPDSLAIDRGNCTDMSGAVVGADQRGVVRPQGATCDIGAYESNGSVATTRYYCWDLDEDDTCDPATEDQNGDGDCTPLDCAGVDGLMCWDLDGNGACDLASEDATGDGACSIYDCRGAPGVQGPACWDLDLDHVCDAGEDFTGDSNCTVADCRGIDGADGVDGHGCWDLDQDYVCDPAEDINGDSDCTPVDCVGPAGPAGADGADGYACWDLDTNGVCNVGTEDASGDGVCTVLDCRGAPGVAGFSCWDLNTNHVCDAAEDMNGDLACNVVDCRGAQGVDGLACWDRNASGTCDPGTEDQDGDGTCSVLDCLGQDGVDGRTCWDTDADYLCDPAEDVNGDDDCTVADCRGATGSVGPIGVSCWDLDGNATCDVATEDLDGDGVCDLEDCRGIPGADGASCWDLNDNHVCDAPEDMDGDSVCNARDCITQDGLDCWDLDADQICDPDEDANDDGACTPADCRGADGRDGVDGTSGTDGQDGRDGQDGSSSLMNVLEEPPGNHCAEGGVRVEVGADDDGDGLLTEDEVDDVEYVCNGLSGPAGSNGDDGESGPDGRDGKDGGCGCRAAVGASDTSRPAWAALCGLLGLAAVSRRRRPTS